MRIPLAHLLSGNVIWHATECRRLEALSPSLLSGELNLTSPQKGICLLSCPALRGGCGAASSSVTDSECQGITPPSRSSSMSTSCLGQELQPPGGSSTLGSHLCCGTCCTVFVTYELIFLSLSAESELFEGRGMSNLVSFPSFLVSVQLVFIE